MEKKRKFHGMATTSRKCCCPCHEATSQQSGGCIVSSSEHEMTAREKTLLEPEGDTFKPYQGVPKRIGEIIKGKFPGAWPTWGEVPIQQRDLWFAEFKKYYYWLPEHDRQVRRNFEVRGAKQLRNLFGYARKSHKAPHFVSPDNWAQLQNYWEGDNFQRLSTQNKKNRSSDPEGVGPSLHTCGATPVTKWRRRLATSLQREPTVDELYKETHTLKKKDSTGNWMCKKSELRLEEHRKRWQEYRSSQPSTNNSSGSPPLSEHDIWVEGNLTNKGCVYGFGSEGVLMKQPSCLSTSSRSSSVKNYDAREMAMRLNEGAVKAAEEARQVEEARQKELEEFRREVEQLKANEAKVANELAREKAARQRDKSKINKLWRFFKSQQAGSSTAPPDSTPSGNDDDDEDDLDTADLGDSSHE